VIRDPRLQGLLACGLIGASGTCLALLVVRVQIGGSHAYGFLAWNLLLAWTPVGFALCFDRLRGRARPLAVPAGLLWLLFLPNAPYVLTDFVHLGHEPGGPLWLDATMLSAFAATALMLGFLSLLVVGGCVEAVFGRTAAILAAILTLAVASIGVALGRYPGWNSWDVITTPSLLPSLLRGSWTPHMSVFALAFAATLTVVYAALLLAFGRLARGQGSGCRLPRQHARSRQQ
jgi:uncharacterized membrane protein